MKKLIIIILIIISFNFSGCSFFSISQNNNSSDIARISETNNQEIIEEITNEEKTFIMKIDNTIVDITWEDNNSVKELMEYAKNGLTITMSRYGEFEQVVNKGVCNKHTEKCSSGCKCII